MLVEKGMSLVALKTTVIFFSFIHLSFSEALLLPSQIPGTISWASGSPDILITLMSKNESGLRAKVGHQ